MATSAELQRLISEDIFGGLLGNPQQSNQQNSLGFTNALDGLSFGNMGATSDFMNIPGTTNANSTDSWGLWNKLMGNDKEMGPLAKGVGIGSALLQGFTGWKNYGLQKDKFDFEKEAYNKNYANQVQSYNTQLANQANQKASATGDFAGAQDYINRHRLG